MSCNLLWHTITPEHNEAKLDNELKVESLSFSFKKFAHFFLINFFMINCRQGRSN